MPPLYAHDRNLERILKTSQPSTSFYGLTPVSNIATNDDDDDYSYLRTLRDDSRRYDNTTSITSTVSIRVTPREDYYFSWSFLWIGFLLASVIAAWQVYREQRIINARIAADIENGGAEVVSSADRTRCTFRRLLLLAMLSRLIFMPVMVWSYPLWLQFVGDTLPEMIFATAWTLMVTFFVQLVASATGIVANTDASFVIQATAYIVYTCLVVLELFNSVASILLYALLWCIYAALLGSIAYFCPKLMTLLQPSFENHSALVLRLYLCTLVCFCVFLGHMVVFARLVIATPHKVYWWLNYGILELIPAVIFLFLMNPNSNKAERRGSPEPALEEPSKKLATATAGNALPVIRRIDSAGSASSNANNNHKRVLSNETASLLKNSQTYGSTHESNKNPE